MRKIKSLVIIIAALLAVACIAVMALCWWIDGGIFFLPPSYNKFDGFLKANMEELSYAANALLELRSELDCDYIVIYMPRGEEKTYRLNVGQGRNEESIFVPDELSDCIKSLHEKKVESIGTPGGIVIFTMWSVADELRSIYYSETGEPPAGMQLIEVEQLSEENWYFCVDNFEKAKARYPERFR